MDNLQLAQSLGGSPLGSVPGVAQASNAMTPMATATPQAPAQPITPPAPMATPVAQSTQPTQPTQPTGPMSNADLAHQLGSTVPGGPSDAPGVFQSVVQAVAKPFLSLATAGLNYGAAAKDLIDNGGQASVQATQDINAPRNFGYFGTVGPSSSFREAAGSTIDAGSWFLGTGEADALKEATTVLSKVKLGAKVGAVIGGTQGLGSGLADPNATVGSVAGSTFSGTAGGALAGAVLTPTLSAIPQITKQVTKLFTKGVEDTAAPVAAAAEESGGKLATFVKNQVKQDWRDALNLPNSVTQKEGQSGKDVVSLLTDAHMKPDDIVDGRIVTDNNQEIAKQHALVADHALTTLLGTEPKVIDASELLDKAMGELKSTGTNLDAARGQVQKQLAAFIRQLPDDLQATPGAADGGVQLRLNAVNEVKGSGWTNVVDFADPAKTVKNDANTAIARAAKDIIEKNVSDINIQKLNSHIGDWWHALEVLQDRNGKKVMGRGITRIAMKAAGSVVGTVLTHGLGGTIGGEILGGKISEFMTDSLLPMDVKLAILKKLEGDPETAPLVKQAWEIINKRMGEMVQRPQLAAGSGPMNATAANVPEGMQGRPEGMSNTTIMAGPPSGAPVQGSMTGDVPRPDIARGAGMYVVPRSSLNISDSVTPKPIMVRKIKVPMNDVTRVRLPKTAK